MELDNFKLSFFVIDYMRKVLSFVAIFFICYWTPVFAQNGSVIHYEAKTYKISFPGEPKKMTQNVPSEVGQLNMIIAMYEPQANDDNHIYMIAETDYPDSSIHSDKTEMLDKFFRGAIDGALKNLNSDLIKEVPGHVGKYPSRSIEIDYKKGLAVIKMELILCKSKLISIQTITATKKFSNPSVDKFFASFELKTN